MNTVREILDQKPAGVWSVPSTTKAYEALEIMANKDIGAVLVMDNGKLVGMFSERDYARKVILKGKSSRETSVSDLMTQKVYYVTPDRTIEDCMRLFTDKHVRHLPVIEADSVIGIITIGDVVKKIISQQEFTISELEKYITGGF